MRNQDGLTPLESARQRKENIETDESLKHFRDLLEDYDRIIEMLQKAEEQ